MSSRLVVGIIYDKRGDPPYISVNKLWKETVTIVSQKYDVELLRVSSYNVENNEEYRAFVEKIDILMLLSPYYTIDRTVKDFPMIFYGLGSMQKGGHWLVNNNNSFRSYDEAILNSSSCVYIFDELVMNNCLGREFIPFGVDISTFYPRNNKNEIRQKYDVPEDAFVMLYCGRINIQKNPALLLSMLRDLKNKYPKLILMFIGSYDNFYISEFNDSEAPKIKNQFNELIEKYDLADRIIFFETQLDVNVYSEMINMADIGINITTLISENFGYTPVEMQACGLPVIGTDWGGLKDTIIDGVSGFRIETVQSEFGARINIEAAKDRIAFLIDNRDKLKEMGKNARKNIEMNFSEEIFAKKLQDLIKTTYDKFIKTAGFNKKIEINPIMINMTKKLHEKYKTCLHISDEHLHPEIDFEHYEMIASKCASCRDNETTWNKDTIISKGFDWGISGNKFVSYDPRWNMDFELKDCTLDDNDIHFLSLVKEGESVAELIDNNKISMEKTMYYLKEFTKKGMIVPWEKNKNEIRYKSIWKRYSSFYYSFFY